MHACISNLKREILIFSQIIIPNVGGDKVSLFQNWVFGNSGQKLQFFKVFFGKSKKPARVFVKVGNRIYIKTSQHIHRNNCNSSKISTRFSFKDTDLNRCHSKLILLSKNVLHCPQCFNKNSLDLLVGTYNPKIWIPQLPLTGKLDFS